MENHRKMPLPGTGQKKGKEVPESGLMLCGISPPDERNPEEGPIRI